MGERERVNEIDRRYRTVAEELDDDEFEYNQVSQTLIGSCYRIFLRLIRYVELRDPACFIENEKRLLKERFATLRKHHEDRRRAGTPNMRDVLLEEWAKLHYDGAESFFRERYCDSDNEWESPDEDGLTQKGYFQSIVGERDS